MKKILYAVLALATLVTVACQQEKVNGELQGDTAKVSFTVGLEGLQTKAVYSDGVCGMTTGTPTLYVLAYRAKEDGTYQYLSNVSVTKASAFDSGLKAQVELTLVKGETYDFLFWAQNPETTCYVLDKENGTITVQATPAPAANDDTRDAFFARVNSKYVSTSFQENVTLKRPFAQINVLTTEKDYNTAVVDNEIVFTGSSMKLTAPSVLNLHDGKVGTATISYDFQPAAVNPLDVYATTVFDSGLKDELNNPIHYRYIAMNYILAGDRDNVDLTFSVYRDDLVSGPLYSFNLNNVPFERNFRTNIFGNVFSVEGEFNIQIDPTYDGEILRQFEGEVQTITPPATIPAGITYDPTNPLVGTAEIAVDGGSLDFSGFTSNSGNNPTYSSSDPAVGTIDGAGIFTPVAPGTTNVTIHFNAVIEGVEQTKADAEPANYASTEIVFAVTVSGTEPTPPAPAGDGSLANPYSASEAYAAVSAMEANVNSTEDLYVKGKISYVKSAFSSGYGTAIFNISDDGTSEGPQFQCYSVFYLGNVKWADGDAQIAVGDDVVVCGKLVNYSGTTPETASKKAYVYSLNGQTSIAPTPLFGVEKTAFEVGAAATTVTINVTGNVAWTAAGEGVSCEPASGTGAGDVVVTFPANTDTENSKKYTVTVATEAEVEVKSIDVTVDQAAASSTGGGDEPGGESTPVVIDLTTGFGNGTAIGVLVVDGVTFTPDKGTNKNGPTYYTTGNAARFYGGNSFKLSAEKTITKVTLSFASGEGTNEITTDVGTFASPDWTGSSTAVEFTIGGTSGHRRIAKIEVTLAAE